MMFRTVPETLRNRFIGNIAIGKLHHVLAMGSPDLRINRRGFLLRGGEIDEERTAKAVADDFRKGKLGRITLELPEEV